jgi:hypothetical protein
MNVNELKRNELRHLDAVITHLEIWPFNSVCAARSFINDSTYWKSRLFKISCANAEPDIEVKVRKLLDRLSVISG